MATVFPFFGPLAPRSGVMPVALVGRLDGTVGNSGDTVFSFGGYPRRAAISRFIVSQEVLMTSGGAVTAVVQKYDASANAAVVLTAAVDLLTATQVAREGYAIDLLASLTQEQRTLDVGDTLEVKVTAASTMTGQPTDFFCTAELLVLE